MDKYILFLSRDDEILLTKVGQKIKDRYEIKNFLEDKLTLYSDETDEEIELNLEEDFARESTPINNNSRIKNSEILMRPNLLQMKEKGGL